jgi:metal-dependent hydrolase (beta-lactamase superfamily II)
MSKRRPIQVLLADDQPNVRSALHRLLKHEPGVKVVGEASEANESVLVHNLGLLGKCPRDTGALILSHAHVDHTGGLKPVLS